MRGLLGCAVLLFRGVAAVGMRVGGILEWGDVLAVPCAAPVSVLLDHFGACLITERELGQLLLGACTERLLRFRCVDAVQANLHLLFCRREDPQRVTVADTDNLSRDRGAVYDRDQDDEQNAAEYWMAHGPKLQS